VKDDKKVIYLPRKGKITFSLVSSVMKEREKKRREGKFFGGGVRNMETN